MQSYQINELERLTGVKSHTIRIWEKRYELIRPHRTTTNRRYYDDSQVRKLLNVTTLLSKGYKISKIAALTEKEINKQVLTEAEMPDEANTIYINDMVKAMLAYDETAFEKAYAAAISFYGMYYTILNVVYPFLAKTGTLWSVEETIPAQEHFANVILRRKIIAATETLPPRLIKENRFLLFLPPGEWHEIGLLFADYILRSNGYDTIYLGQNVPYENINKIATTLTPAYMLLFYVAARPAKEIEKQIKELAKENPGVKILISGKQELFTEVKSTAKNVTYLFDVNSLLELIA